MLKQIHSQCIGLMCLLLEEKHIILFILVFKLLSKVYFGLSKVCLKQFTKNMLFFVQHILNDLLIITL